MEIKDVIHGLKKQITSQNLATSKTQSVKLGRVPLHHMVADCYLDLGLIYLQKLDYPRALLNLFKCYKQKIRLEGSMHKSQQRVLMIISQIFTKENNP